jgi:putative lipoic acid-binding regulatory protein
VSEVSSSEQFPCFYTFKIFGRASETFVPRVREIIGATLGEVPLDSIKVRESAQRRYLSLTVISRVYSRSQLEKVYTDLQAEEEVLLYI